MGTLTEVREKWTIDDVFDAHEILDAQEQHLEMLRSQQRLPR